MIKRFKLFESINEPYKVYPIGTKVILIDNDGIGFLNRNFCEIAKIYKGEEYEIEEVNPIQAFKNRDNYKLKDVEGCFLANRFISSLEYYANKYNV